MSRIQVLVTTMYQTDISKYSEMNLQTDAVIANQTDFNSNIESYIDGNNVIMVSSTTRGLSRNRNIALAHSNQKAEYLLFSDDDLIFNDGYEKLIIDEFEAHPEAEAIKFNIHDISSTRKISMKRIQRFEKATRRNMSSSGVWGLVIKRNVIVEKNLKFNENFGTGTINFCGEDTIFLMDMLNKRISFFRSPVDIAGIDQTESSWFEGYNEKYFITNGRMLKTVFPYLSCLIAIRSAYKFSRRKKCNMKFWGILKLYYKGILRKENC